MSWKSVSNDLIPEVTSHPLCLMVFARSESPVQPTLNRRSLHRGMTTRRSRSWGITLKAHSHRRPQCPPVGWTVENVMTSPVPEGPALSSGSPGLGTNVFCPPGWLLRTLKSLLLFLCKALGLITTGSMTLVSHHHLLSLHSDKALT